MLGGTLAAPFAFHSPLFGAVPATGSFRFRPSLSLIPAPKDPQRWPAFREELNRWREQARRDLNYDDSMYRKPEFAWASSSFACCFVMVCDETFYERKAGAYQIDAFLEHGRREFGGYDSLVLWQAYPRIGVDDRNQFDMYRDLPGGLAGVRRAVESIQRRGTRVYVDYNPWDTGTRREGKSDVEALAELVRALQADGIFLDTMNRGSTELRAALDAARPGVVLESEGALPLERIHDHHASWAQWFEDSEAPGILRNKWFERRHMQHQISRWDRDHTAELHTAWMNGAGMLVWENVFGSWLPWCARDRSLLQAMLPIQRRYAALFTSDRWTPLVATEQTEVFASLWEAEGLRLWTLVNRAEQPVQGPLLRCPLAAGHRHFDLIAGRELNPGPGADGVVFEGTIPPRGLGCFLSADETRLGKDFKRFLATMARLNARADFNVVCPRRETRLVAAPRAKPLARVPAGMVEIPAATLDLTIIMRTRECGFYESAPLPGVSLRQSYNLSTQTFHRQGVFRRFAVDETPVTNAQYAEFVAASRYRPRHRENFLRHWVDGKPAAGAEDHPVVYVDLDDARAYARWAGKRLPTEEEWQYAAQGPDGRIYPWGNEMQPGRCNGGETGSTTPVKAYPDGRSPFGCYDMCGNVWHWTESERTDGRTRFCIIRGGAFFAARGSNWYVDGGPRPANFATKFLMMWPGLDRCATIGFRCVADLGV